MIEQLLPIARTGMTGNTALAPAEAASGLPGAVGIPFRLPDPMPDTATVAAANIFRPLDEGGNVLPVPMPQPPPNILPTLAEVGPGGPHAQERPVLVAALAPDALHEPMPEPMPDPMPDLELGFPLAPVAPSLPGPPFTSPPPPQTPALLHSPVDTRMEDVAAISANAPEAIETPAGPMSGHAPALTGTIDMATRRAENADLRSVPGRGDPGIPSKATVEHWPQPPLSTMAPAAPQAQSPVAPPAPIPVLNVHTAEIAQAPEIMSALRQTMADLARDGAAENGRSADPGPRADATAGAPASFGSLLASGAGSAERPSFFLPTPPGNPQFAEQVAERVVWMAGQKLDRAQIRLNPAHLGPIAVDVSVGEDGAATVTFTAQHAMTRDALEQALPRLREMFSDSGVMLAGADVSGQGAHGRDGGNGPDESAGPGFRANIGGAPDGESGSADVAAGVARATQGLIDTYV